MTNDFSNLLSPFSGMQEDDLLELLSDKMTEFLSHTDNSQYLKYVDDSTMLLDVPDGYSVSVNTMLFFESMGCLSYSDGDIITPLYLDLDMMFPDWRVSAGGITCFRTLTFVFGVYCRVLFDLTGDSWYMEASEDVNAICWGLADFYDIEH